MQCKFKLAILETLVDVRLLRLPCTAVPHHYGAASVLPLGDDAFESSIIQGMILNSHGQPFDRWIKRGSFGNCPRQQHSLPFETKVVVQVTGLMLLNNE